VLVGKLFQHVPPELAGSEAFQSEEPPIEVRHICNAHQQFLTPHSRFLHTPTAMINLAPKQFRTAANLQKSIQWLQKGLGQLLDGPVQPATMAPRKRKISAAGIAGIRAAAKARWAKVRAAKTAALRLPVNV
jgi:hypothetical protein